MDVAFQQALTLVVQTVIQLYLLLVILRFLLQVARADFYNPLSQFIVKATDPPLKPLRRIVPGFAGLDIAAIVLAVLIQLLGVTILALIAGGLPQIPTLLIVSLYKLLSLLIDIYFWGLIISVVASWLAPGGGHPGLMLIHQILEPLMGPLRRRIPPMGGFDLSPIVAFLLLNVLRIFLDRSYSALLLL